MAAMTGNAIREALEPFAMCGDILKERDGWDESDTLSLFTTDDFGDADCLIQTFKVRDLRRARTAYNAIGSGVKAETAACFIQRSSLAELRKDKTATTTVCSPLLKQPFGDPVALYTKEAFQLSTHTAANARPSDDRLWDQTLTERDNYHDAADKLAEAIGELLGVEVGEHSSAHSPWESALEHAGQAVRNREISTHTAAEAGPVGEAKGVVVFDPVYYDGRYPAGTPSPARPVEEPGEAVAAYYNPLTAAAKDAEASMSMIDEALAEKATERAHRDDTAVDRFASSMKTKMAVARSKGRNGWDDPEDCPSERLSRMLREHVEKGDPIDVANFCMMLHQRGERIAARPVEEPGEVEELQRKLAWLRQCNRLEARFRIAAEAALVETRERLEKRDADVRYLVEAIWDTVHVGRLPDHTRYLAIRDAITGDAQEAGR